MQSAPQVGHRAVSVSSSSIMASIIFIKDTGILCLLLSGLLLPSVLVSGQNTSATTASTTVTAASNTSMTQLPDMNTALAASSSAVTPTENTYSTAYGGTVISTTIQSPTTTPGSVSQSTHSTSATSRGSAIHGTQSGSSTHEGSTSSSTQFPSTTSESSAPHSTNSASSTSGGSSSSSTHSPLTTSESSAPHSTHSLSSTSGGSSSSSIHSSSATSGGLLHSTSEGSNTSTTSNSSMNMMYCPSFSCYYSECYSMYNNKNASACVSGESCQLLRSMDMWYNVSCSAFCAERCTNMSQTNCSVNCCNSTGCLNGSFASMMMTTTVAATTTTKAPTTTSTTANNGNKCYKGTCTGETCYKYFKSQTLETCSSTQPHCQLRKETAEFFWTAGCSNCTGYTACKDTTKPPCNLECCTATTTSCLMLNGTLNVPSFATRGPYLHTELIASLLCLLAITLLL
ncbi:hypothetical protein CHARACLAT_020629 [Characodon lateralis]|uniref:Uncharacterized protein n=1 Tax=Characodon lateralis TaxID=208331 RepID=A0ABU7DID0_9TELE|nr:hypothetical protein [Characodon lateralis]